MSLSHVDEIKFDEKGLVPAVIQEHGTGEVLMVGYMSRESLARTMETGLTWFYSRSRQRLWQKGETSGHVQRVKRIKADCDLDTLLIEVEQAGPGTCHKGYKSCFHNEIAGEGGRTGSEGSPSDAPVRTFDPGKVYGDPVVQQQHQVNADPVARDPHRGNGGPVARDPHRMSGDPVVRELYGVIESRKQHPVQGSYTSYLFDKGLDKILKKVGEESTEVLIAAKNQDKNEFIAESADLIYHLLVAMVEVGVHPDDVWAELAKRRGGGGSEDAPPGK